MASTIKTDAKQDLKPFSARFTKAPQNGASGGSPTKIPQSTKVLPPFTSLSLLPNEIGFHMMKKQNEVVVADLIKTPSMVLVDAGTPRVMSRLYGGFHPDWVCGGEWTNSSSFVQCINKFCKDKKHKLVVAFDAAIDSNNLSSWLAKMEWDYENIKEVYNIVAATGHPPCASNKRVAALWFPPTSLQTTLRLICLSQGIKMHCTLYEHEPELVAVPNVRDPQSKSLMDEVGVFFTNSLEFLCYTDLNVANLLWGESLKLNMRGDRMTGKKIDRDDVAVTLGISNESLDAGLLYYGTRYFLDYSNTDKSKALQEHDEEKKAGRLEFDPTEDLHHEMLAALTPEDSKPERRLKQALSIMRQVHQDGINKKSSLNVGESLLPSIEHITRCLTENNPLPPDFEELSRDDERQKVEALTTRLRNRAEDAFFEIGSRLIEGRLQTPPEPYFKDGKRVVFPHQTRFTENFLTHLEKSHKSGNHHEWVAHLIFSQEPTVRIPYTMGDRGRIVMKLKEDPKLFFREIRRRAYGLLFASAAARDFTSDNVPQNVYVREIDYATIDIVFPSPVSLDIARLTSSSEALWGSKDTMKSLFVLLNVVLGANVPRNWEQMFSKIPEICWIPVIAVRYMLERCPALFIGEHFLDVLMATIASVATCRIQNPSRAVLSDFDRTASDAEMHMDVGSITFVSYFMTAVEHVIFANDIVQQAIPTASVNPVQFFDGNVFHTFYDLRKRNHGLEGFLGAPDKKIEIFLKVRHLALFEYQNAEVLSQSLFPREDTADRLLRGRFITEAVLTPPLVNARRGEQKRSWEATADSQMPMAQEQRTGMLPNPYGFQPLLPQPPIMASSAAPLYGDQTYPRPAGQYY